MNTIQASDRAVLAAQNSLALLELLNHAEGMQCWIKDRNRVIVWANKALLLHYSASGNPEEVIGKTDYELSTIELAEQFRRDDEIVMSGVPVINRVELVTGVDSLISWHVTTKIPVYDADGSIIGTVGMTRRKEDKNGATVDEDLPKALQYIREHYTEPTNTGILALILRRSEEEVEKMFHSQLGMSPADYLRRHRVYLACHDLVNPKLGFDEIARKNGFSDSEQFVIDFQQETKQTPRAYRLNLYQRGAVRN